MRTNRMDGSLPIPLPRGRMNQSEAETGSKEMPPHQPTHRLRDMSGANRDIAAREKQLRAFEEEYKASNAYQRLHDRLASRFPIGAADGTPIGLKLSQLSGPMLKTSDLLPGDILVSYEPDEKNLTFPSRQLTLDKQALDHNGIPAKCNQGDYRNVHNAMWTSNAKNLQATEAWGHGEPKIVEGRGAFVDAPRMAKTDVMRVQPTAGSVTLLHHCKVYRPKDPNFADWMAQVAMNLANGHVEYSKKEIRTAAGGNFQFTPKAKKAAIEVAEDAFNPAPAWALNAVNTDDRFKKGINCTSFIVRVAQAAQRQILREEERESGSPNARFEDVVDKLTGMGASNPEHVSVRTIEHLLLHSVDAKGEPQFEFVGKFQMKPDDVAYDEKSPPMAPAQLPPLPDTHPHVVKPKAKL